VSTVTEKKKNCYDGGVIGTQDFGEK